MNIGMAQIFTSVSPKTTEEFEVRYMSRIFGRFGAIYYGCCDRLDDRLDIITKMPNIRKISCSPWSDREKFAANLPQKYIMSNKPSPALLAHPTFDEEAVRAFEYLSRTEGIIPAIESSHAVAHVLKIAPEMPKDSVMTMVR